MDFSKGFVHNVLQYKDIKFSYNPSQFIYYFANFCNCFLLCQFGVMKKHNYSL